MVEKYWKGEPGLIFLTALGIRHDHLRECENRGAQCKICTGAQKSENHKCGVSGCTIGGKVKSALFFYLNLRTVRAINKQLHLSVLLGKKPKLKLGKTKPKKSLGKEKK